VVLRDGRVFVAARPERLREVVVEEPRHLVALSPSAR
jgi:hypothetical protein